MIYEPDQFKKILPFINGTPECLILGGPADANEAQTAIGIFPNIKVIAVEPLHSNVQWQRENGFPSDGILIEAALGREPGQGTLFIGQLDDNSHRCCSLSLDHAEGSSDSSVVTITTIDTLVEQYGQPKNVLLWLDIEGFEYEALLGAKNSLSQVNWINVEFAHRSEKQNLLVCDLLHLSGFTESFIWNQRDEFHDRFFRRPSLRTYNFADPEMSSSLIAGNEASSRHMIGKEVHCLEIGVYDGRSACWVLDNILTHPNATYTGVDYIGDHIEAHKRAKLNLEYNHPGKYTLLIGDSLKVVPELVFQNKRYDIIHIDGCHSFGGCLGDLTNIWPLLNPGGVIICDDYCRADYGVAAAVHKFLATLEIVTDYQITYLGYSIAWRRNS